MKKIALSLIIALLYSTSSAVSSPRYSFMQANNINTVFMNNGIYNYDWFSFTTYDAGLIWPASAPTRMTADFTTGIWIGAKINNQIRLAASMYNTHFSGGNIPVIGQVPPSSVCNDTSFKVYLVSLTDQSLINGGVRTVTAGGRQYTLNFSSWAAWPVNQGAPYYEVNNVPGYQPGWTSDRPSIGNGSSARPDQLLFTVFMDYTNCTNNIHLAEISLPGGSLPLGAEIQQLAFAFNCYPIQNMYFTKYRVINKSGQTWDSTYISLSNDADIGAGSCGAIDDAYGSDSARGMSFIYNADNFDCNYLSNPPAMGTRMLQSPVKYTGNPLDTAHLPYGNLVGYKLVGMSSGVFFINASPDPCLNDPDEYISGFNYMKGLNGCGVPFINRVTGAPSKFVYSGNACLRTGWFDSNAHDSRYVQSSGPLTMASGDTQVVVFSFMVSRDGINNFQNICTLQSISDSALWYYYHDFPTCFPIGIQPISNEVPQKFMLYQNYPNPFNPSTTIRFAIPPLKGASGMIRLVIYNSLGQEISTLVNEELKPGTYEIQWNAENYPSGVYFYKLISENFTDSKKMVIVK